MCGKLLQVGEAIALPSPVLVVSCGQNDTRPFGRLEIDYKTHGDDPRDFPVAVVD